MVNVRDQTAEETSELEESSNHKGHEVARREIGEFLSETSCPL